MAEQIEVLDEFGNKTGKSLDINEVHEKGLWHKVIKVVVLNENNQLLAQKRSATKKIFPNVWDIAVTGHVSAGEEPIKSAQRELYEELGITIEEKEIKYLFSYKKNIGYNSIKEKMFIDLFYIKSPKDLKDFKILEEEVSEIKFVNIFDMKDLINDDYFIEDGELDNIIKQLKGICYDN